jgi:hypothetical protein
MNRLWVFGDNSSSIFGRTKERRFEYYKNYRNGNFPISWSELLSNELNFKLNNYAIAGQSNYDVFEWFCKTSTNLQENDVVIIGWSYVERFRLYDEFSKDYVTIRPNALKYSNTLDFLNGVSLDTINETLNNRRNNGWYEEIGSWEILINEYCKLKNCSVFYWTFDERLNKSYYIGGSCIDFREHLISIGAEDITTETNGKLIDNNFGEVGHQIQSQYFLNYLNGHITY